LMRASIMRVLSTFILFACALTGHARVDPVKSPVLGCSVLHNCGEIFDDYSTGYHGAIAEICFAKHKAGDTGATTLSEIITNYAGHPVPHGGNKSSINDGQSCFALEPGEAIVAVEAEIKENKDPEKNSLESLRFNTSLGRTSLWFGRASRYGLKYPVQGITAPSADVHVVAVHGYGTESNKTNAIFGLGVYWGAGGGAGSWVPISSCVGCGSWSFDFEYGTKKTSSTETQVTQTWTNSVTFEMGFSFDGFSAGLSISNTYSKSVMHDSKDSFEVTTLQTKHFTCDKDNLYQWQMTSNFDDPSAPSSTFTSFMACTDNFEPCCLPGTFSNDPTVCDLKPEAPSSCSATSLTAFV